MKYPLGSIGCFFLEISWHRCKQRQKSTGMTNRQIGQLYGDLSYSAVLTPFLSLVFAVYCNTAII